MLEPPRVEPKLVTADDARAAQPNVPPPDSKAIAETKNAHEAGMHKMQRGIVVYIVGTGPAKAGNVATVAIFASFGLVMVAFFKFDFSSKFDLFYKVLTTMLGQSVLRLDTCSDQRNLNSLFGRRHAARPEPPALSVLQLELAALGNLFACWDPNPSSEQSVEYRVRLRKAAGTNCRSRTCRAISGGRHAV